MGDRELASLPVGYLTCLLNICSSNYQYIIKIKVTEIVYVPLFLCNLFVLPALFICVCIYLYLFTYKNNYIQINMTYFPPGLDPPPFFLREPPRILPLMFWTVSRTGTGTDKNFIIGCCYFLKKCKLPVRTKIIIFVAGTFLVVIFLLPCNIVICLCPTYRAMMV